MCPWCMLRIAAIVFLYIGVRQEDRFRFFADAWENGTPLNRRNAIGRALVRTSGVALISLASPSSSSAAAAASSMMLADISSPAHAATTTTITNTATTDLLSVSTRVQEQISSLEARFLQDIIKQPPVSSASGLHGIDNTYYPDFMIGTWDVIQTLVNVKAPLGFKFLGGPSGDESVAIKSITESRTRLNEPVRFQLRWVSTPWGVVEDRLLNTRQRLNAFAGRNVVVTVDYADVSGSNRASVLAMGGSEHDPLQTTVVRFKGPAAQKSFVTSHGGVMIPASQELVDNNNDDNQVTSLSSSSLTPASWIGFETQRSIFALTNQSTAPPIFTDTELLWKVRLITDDHVVGQLRIAGYLNPNDQLYFEARNRAVSIQDYTLDMRRAF